MVSGSAGQTPYRTPARDRPGLTTSESPTPDIIQFPLNCLSPSRCFSTALLDARRTTESPFCRVGGMCLILFTHSLSSKGLETSRSRAGRPSVSSSQPLPTDGPPGACICLGPASLQLPRLSRVTTASVFQASAGPLGTPVARLVRRPRRGREESAMGTGVERGEALSTSVPGGGMRWMNKVSSQS